MKFLKKQVGIYLILAVCLISGCGTGRQEAAVPSPQEETAAPEEAQPQFASGAGKAVISEVQPKNKATWRSESGKFSDWIEIQNISGETLSFSGWHVDTGEDAISLDGLTAEPGGYLLVCASLKINDTVRLLDANGETADECRIFDDTADFSIARNPEGVFVSCKYPTPGMENSGESFDYLQSLRTAQGPLEISEVCVENFSYAETEGGFFDWVELKNISQQSINLSNWAISDDEKDPMQRILPDLELPAGECFVILCDKDAGPVKTDRAKAEFSLDSTSDRLYLTALSGELADYVALRDIPYGKTYGRIDGENGFFYLDLSTPEKGNEKGCRRVCESPEVLTPYGVFNKVKAVEVTLSGDGDIYYTTDGSRPDVSGIPYTGTFSVEETCVVKAVCTKEGLVDSRPLVLSYIINENDTLPVVSVTADDIRQFDNMMDNAYYSMGLDKKEIPGTISYFGDDGSFSLGAGIKLHGYSTLVLPKKNLSFRFRGCYGAENLDFDLFGDGERTNYTNLLLRAGGDQTNTAVKNEVCLNIARELSDSVMASRNKYVDVYVNGRYKGIYSLMEKNNEQWYADIKNVKKSEVTMTDEPVYEGEDFYQEVLTFAYNRNLEDPENYEQLCSVLDIDSLIDWTILEGFFANWDLQSGNIRYVKADGGKWQLVLYDLDNALGGAENCYDFVFSYINQVSALNGQLMKNPDYRQRFCERAANLLRNGLTAESIWAEFERLSEEIDTDMKRNPDMEYDAWVSHLENQKDVLLKDYDWYNSAAKKLCHYFKLTREEEILYFGELH